MRVPGRLMQSAIGVHGVQAMAALLRLLPERDSHPRLHDAFAVILDSLDTPQEAGALYVRFELAVLEDLGFGLDLSTCAATGAHSEDLVYVSRQSQAARFVRKPGRHGLTECWRCLRSCADRTQACTSASMLDQAFRLTGYFLGRHVFEPRGVEPPISRESFCAAALRAMPQEAPVSPPLQEPIS
jgi:DNA repair protein RecO (recombination protein O)